MSLRLEEREREREREIGRGRRFFVHANWPIVFFKGQTTHPFLSSPPFIRPFLLSPLPARLLDPSADFRGKRNGGYQMYGNKEEAGLNSGGVDAPLKGRRWMLPLPSFAALHRRAGHFSLRSPLSRGYSFVPSFRQSNRTQQSIFSRISIDYM